jgi:hypothetical protein
MSPEDGMLVFEDLQRAVGHGLNLEHPLHIVYLVTPNTHKILPDFQKLWSLSEVQSKTLDSPFIRVLEAVGLDCRLFHKWSLQPPSYSTMFASAEHIRKAKLNAGALDDAKLKQIAQVR